MGEESSSSPFCASPMREESSSSPFARAAERGEGAGGEGAGVEGEEEGEADIAAEQAHVHKCHLCS
jgi:hypothetical protein